MKTKPEVELYDTTLRDGSQGEGINFSVADKLRIAEKLDQFGVHYIEGGWPGSNPKDIEFFEQAQKLKFKNARLAAFGSTRKANVKVGKDKQVQLLIRAGTPVVTIYGKTSILHVKEVLRCSPEENLAMIRDTVHFLKKHGKFVIYDAEHAFDGWKLDRSYARKTWLAAEEGGADMIVLCDTNGGSLPWEIMDTVRIACAYLKVPIGVHTHNDAGFADANSLMAVEGGAVHVQGTINGYGERTGNANLTTLIPALALKMDKRCVSEVSLRKLCELSLFVDEIANIGHNPRLPWVGSAAFSHKGGTHVNAVQKLVSSYEHVAPELVGNSRRILVSDLSGRSNIVMKAAELGFKIANDAPQLKNILSRIKELEHGGYEFEAAEGSLSLLLADALTDYQAPFEVIAHHVSMRRDSPLTKGTKGKSVCEATIKVRVGKQIAHRVAEGDGPVNALDSALRLALGGFFPELKKVVLSDFKVRNLKKRSGEGEIGTASRTRVFIETQNGKSRWGTVGVSTNIIEASLLALVESMEYAILKK